MARHLPLEHPSGKSYRPTMDPQPSVSDQPAATPENPAISPQPTATKPIRHPSGNPHLAPPFNRETAREMQRRATLARNAAKLAKEVAETIKTLPDPQAEGIDSFAVQRLARVRGQLARLDELMEDETDPQKLDRLASAQSRLAEQERQYAGRPLPGSLRPTKDARPSSILSAPASTAPAKARVDQE